MGYPQFSGQEDLEELNWVCFSHRSETRMQTMGILEISSYFFSCFSRGVFWFHKLAEYVF